MIEILKSSLIYRILAGIGSWFGRQWSNSRIIGAFLNTKDDELVAHESKFYIIGKWLRDLLSALFRVLHLDRVFATSLFARPFLWCFLAAVLAPVIPTMILLGLVMLSCVTTIISAAINRQRTLLSAPINKYIIMYAIIYIIATFLSVTFSGSLYIGLLTSVFVMSAFTVENAVTTKKQLSLLVNAMVLVGVIVSFYGFYQYIFGTTGSESWLDDDMFSSIAVRVYSTLQNPNVLSEYLLLIIPLSAACFFSAKTWTKRIIFFCTSGIMCVCMIMTFSRAGWLGLLFAVAVFLVLLDRRFILLFILGIAAIIMMAPDVIISRFTSIGNMSDGSTSYRVAIWLGTLQMLKHYWLTGIGPGTQAFNLIYPNYGYNTATAQHSHNLFFQITCDGGICALIVFILLIIVFIRMMCSAISREKNNKDSTNRIFQISALSSIGGFMVQSMADYSFYNYRVMFLFWVFIGMSALFAHPEKLAGGGNTADDKKISAINAETSAENANAEKNKKAGD